MVRLPGYQAAQDWLFRTLTHERVFGVCPRLQTMTFGPRHDRAQYGRTWTSVHTAGGKTMAVLFSMVSSCQRHSHDPFVYGLESPEEWVAAVGISEKCRKSR
ncbi:hypothetical protein Sinac_0659 [Singulisphaera acidiphila DSM 18658]|uniref:Uncharacterized protein n=1 Tax=Singulisphaera acidiphila (strain ATCC BAA-1392 / DSM 18658 / VKM B-2454 / MOB10) TaxID=886293 RepID=L0D6N8_SINAD|nr:hypothetical protein Sinac_0659 [Singulisphaera acidiphila DSM 18658]